MQYIAWPDHGVPEDSRQFIDFVSRVRQNRTGMVEPTVVHCRLVFFCFCIMVIDTVILYCGINCQFAQKKCKLCVCLYSAGIGRTGVLITMETAMCLIEANEPVHPLTLVRQMRDQRAMLIQTTVGLVYSPTNLQVFTLSNSL